MKHIKYCSQYNKLVQNAIQPKYTSNPHESNIIYNKGNTF